MNAIRVLVSGLFFGLFLLQSSPEALAWQYLRNGSANVNDEASAVAVDSKGNVVVCGTLDIDPSGNTRDHVFVVSKFSGDSGKELWQHEIHGGRFAGALGLAIDAADDIAVAGTLGDDFAVVKLDGVTGALVWLAKAGSEGSAHIIAVRFAVRDRPVTKPRLKPPGNDPAVATRASDDRRTTRNSQNRHVAACSALAASIVVFILRWYTLA
jgi:hypothetical protein